MVRCETQLQHCKIFKSVNQRRKNIFIIEDDQVYAKSLEIFIKHRFPGIGEISIFSIGEMSLMELHRNPGIVIIDYVLNSKFEEAHNGAEIIERIKAQKPQTNIIVLSAREKFEAVLEKIKQYGCIYVKKDQEAFNKIEESIREILGRSNNLVFEPWN